MGTVDPTFAFELMKALSRNAYNYYATNRDHERFGPSSLLKPLWNHVEDRAVALLKRGFRLTRCDRRSSRDISQIEQIQEHIEGLSRLYNLFADEFSKRLLVDLAAFRILGYRRVKLPLNTPDYWQRRKAINKLVVHEQRIPAGFLDWELSLFNLKSIGYDIEVLGVPSSIFAIFVLKQYECARSSIPCKAEHGDFVIDAGACWGDSSLYFANEVSRTGRVYSFEFLPRNLEIMRRNIAVNSHLRDCIDIIEKPLWNASDQPLYYTEDGPATRVTKESPGTGCDKVMTLSIDDFVAGQKVERIDFVKMDIEGAEINALQGAAGTIKKFRPKLAISIYHDLDGFTKIPLFLESLGAGYDFYLSHYTIHLEETILYGVPAQGNRT